MPIAVIAIFRYPVKGLSPERLDRVTLTAGECLPQDRRFAIAHANAQFDPTRPVWLPKTNFLMLMRDEKLAELRTRFEEKTGNLTIEHAGRVVLDARLTDPAGRLSVGQFFGEFLRDTVSGTPTVVEAPGHTFSDAKQKPNSTTFKYVSIVNLASVKALEEVTQVRLDPIRFRANIYIDGVPAWTEFEWVESRLSVGGARLRVISRISRCAATAVNPATAERDVNIPAILQKAFGHGHMGVYAEVSGGGEIVKGDTVVVE
jgi:uncharacterized protein YcbX